MGSNLSGVLKGGVQRWHTSDFTVDSTNSCWGSVISKSYCVRAVLSFDVLSSLLLLSATCWRRSYWWWGSDALNLIVCSATKILIQTHLEMEFCSHSTRWQSEHAGDGYSSQLCHNHRDEKQLYKCEVSKLFHVNSIVPSHVGNLINLSSGSVIPAAFETWNWKLQISCVRPFFHC